MWLRSPPCRGIQEEGSGYGCLKPHPGVRITAKGHGRSYLFSMGPTVPVADWRMDSGGVRLHISVQGGLQKWDSIGVLAHSPNRGGLCSYIVHDFLLEGRGVLWGGSRVCGVLPGL